MYTIYQNDCFLELKNIQDHSIDLILTDPPYGITQNKWDEIPCLEKMWSEFHRVLKKDGVIVLTAAQPFSSQLVVSNLDNFKYDIIWEKTIASGQLNVKKQPLRIHESVLVFAQKPKTYNEQKTKGEPYKITRKGKYQSETYGSQRENSKENDGFRHAKSLIKIPADSILTIPNPRVKGGHPTQKPVALMEYFINTYSNEGDLILDPFMGAGSTGLACLKLKRNFIGIEIEEKYFNMAQEKLKNEESKS